MRKRGPHLLTAVLCEKVIEDKEGVLSLIRIVDQVVQTATGPEAPEQMPPFVLHNLSMVIMLKAGQSRGRYALKLRPEDPGGVQLPPIEFPLQLQGGTSGVNIIAPLQLGVNHEGVYWFDVLFAPGRDEDDQLITRVPLEIVYRPQRFG
jgi:hypothetical protein